MSRIGYAQFEVAFGDFDANALAIRRLCAAASGADLLVFPELAFSGYDLRDQEEAAAWGEAFGEGPGAALLLELSAAHGCTLVAGYVERAAAGCFNACMLATPDGGLHNYRKIHLFDRENLLFLPGDAPPPVIETPAGRVGLMICFDWFFPETARTLALRGAQIIAHPSNLVLPWCQRAMFARSVENRVFTLTANRTGAESHAGRTLRFTGASQLLDPRGECLLHAPEAGEHLALADVTPADADDKGVAGHSDLFAQRRPALYDL